MINIWLAVRNPLRCKPFRLIWNRNGRLLGHKFWELQLSYYAFNLLEIKVDLNWRQTNHAGPWVMLNIFGLQIDARLFDEREWNEFSNCWADANR